MAYLRRYDRVLLAWRRSCVELTGLPRGCVLAALWWCRGCGVTESPWSWELPLPGWPLGGRFVVLAKSGL